MGLLRAGITFVVGYFTIQFIESQRNLIKFFPIIHNLVKKKIEKKKSDNNNNSPCPSSSNEKVTYELYVLLFCLIFKDLIL